MGATMKDVAARAGVALVTVWRALHEPGAVRPATLARVAAAIEELGYVPDGRAAGLRSRRTTTLALLVPTIANTFWTTIARGVEDEASARGYSVFLGNTDDDPAKEARYLEAAVAQRAAGVAIIPAPSGGAALARTLARGLPAVQIHRALAGLATDVVRGDRRAAVAALAGELLARGHRRIAYLGAPPATAPARESLDSFRATLAAAGLGPADGDVHLAPASPEAGYALTAALLGPGRPGALCVGNSRIAVGALRALADAGLRVPGDVAVAAFYDIAALDAYSPTLIAAVQPSYDLGRLAARRLLDRLGDPGRPPTELILPIPVVAYPPLGPGMRTARSARQGDHRARTAGGDER